MCHQDGKHPLAPGRAILRVVNFAALLSRLLVLVAAIFLGANAACAKAPAPLPISAADRPLWLIGNGFHSALGLRTRDAGPRLRALAGDPRAEWMLIGWGHADFFQAKRVTPWLCLKASLLPGRSALHLVPLRRPVETAHPRSDIVSFHVSAQAMKSLRGHLEAAFARESGRERLLGRGYFASSRFYAGRKRFYFPNTCNAWTANALENAGIPASGVTTFLATELVRVAGKHGRRVASRRRPVDAF